MSAGVLARTTAAVGAAKPVAGSPQETDMAVKTTTPGATHLSRWIDRMIIDVWDGITVISLALLAN
jgi:hypothetical protein